MPRQLMYAIKYTNKFAKDLRRCARRGCDMDLMREAIDTLARTGTLPRKYRPHRLSGKYQGRMECHLQPDWLLVWMQNDTELTLLFTDSGTHADLF